MTRAASLAYVFDTRYFTHFGREVSVKQLAAQTGLSVFVLHNRYSRGDRNERLVRPLRSRKP